MSDGSVIIKIKGDDSDLSSKLSSVGTVAKKAMAVTVTAITAATTAMIALGGAAVAVGTDFETSMAKASTLFGDVEVDIDNLESKILEVSSKTGVAATEMGNSLYNALSAGIPVTEDMAVATEVLEKSAMLAKAGFTDVDTALTAVAKTMNASHPRTIRTRKNPLILRLSSSSSSPELWLCLPPLHRNSSK